VRVLGKREEAGRPMLYGTTKEFLDFFSLNDLRELPTLREYSELSDESRQVMSDRLGIEPSDTPISLDGLAAADAALAEAREPDDVDVHFEPDGTPTAAVDPLDAMAAWAAEADADVDSAAEAADADADADANANANANPPDVDAPSASDAGAPQPQDVGHVAPAPAAHRPRPRRAADRGDDRARPAREPR
jgi:segregation and condensation protein B